MIQSRAVTAPDESYATARDLAPRAARLTHRPGAPADSRLPRRSPRRRAARPLARGRRVGAFVAGLLAGARHADRGAAPPSASRRPGRAATTRRCTRAARRRGARRVPRAGVRAPPTARARGDGDRRRALAPAQPRRPRDGTFARPGARSRTRVFGHARGDARAARRGDGDAAGVALARRTWSFPGPARRRAARAAAPRCPPRATLLARDGTVLAEGRDRAVRGPAPSARRRVVGRVGPSRRARRGAARARRTRRTRRSASSGLERVFDARLRGTPGRRAAAPGGRVLARARPRAGRHVRTTIDPEVERAAVDALGRPARRRRGAASRAPARSSRSPASPSRPAAAGLDVQDHHLDRRAARPGSSSRDDRFPVADGGDARGRRARRTPTASRAAARSRRRSPSRATRCSRRSARKLGARRLVGDGRALRLQQAARHPRRGDEHDPAGRRDRRRPRGRLVRDRPGPRAGHRAADGVVAATIADGGAPPAPDAARRRRAAPRRARPSRRASRATSRG